MNPFEKHKTKYYKISLQSPSSSRIRLMWARHNPVEKHIRFLVQSRFSRARRRSCFNNTQHRWPPLSWQLVLQEDVP